MSTAEDMGVIGRDLRIIFQRLEREGRAAEAVVIRDAIGIVAEAAERVVISPAALEIALERKRQVEVEGWTTEHDDEHSRGAMAAAASCYALSAVMGSRRGGVGPDNRYREYIEFYWPWALSWWKPKNPRSDLLRAAALIVAEIERLDRQAVQP